VVSAEAQRFAETLRQAPRMAEMPLEQQRAAGEHAEDLSAEPEGVRYDTVADEGVSGVWAQVTGADPTTTVLYLFGGGHVITSPASRHTFAAHLALARAGAWLRRRWAGGTLDT
jgi:epsilon-lactone hydrolase